MHSDLRINYANLLEVVQRLFGYSQSVNDMRSAIVCVDTLIQSSEGKAIEELKASKQKVLGELDDYQDYLVEIRNLIVDYVNDMTSKIAPKASSSMTRVDASNVYTCIRNLTPGCTINQASMATPYSSDPDVIAQVTQTNNILANLNAEIASISQSIESALENMRQLQKKTQDYEDTDYDHAERASKCYRDKLGVSDWAFESLMYKATSVMGGVFDTFGEMIAGLPAMFTLVGDAFVYTFSAPFGKCPDAVWERREGYVETFNAFIDDPGAVLESMKDDFVYDMDSDPFYTVGSITTGALLLIVGTKGIGKLDDLEGLGKAASEVDLPIRVLGYKPSSGVILTSNPEKTTTVLGNYKDDMQYIIDELDVPKSTDFSGNKGGFNVLNVPNELNQNPEQFFNEYNKPFLDEAIARGDDIVLATKPDKDYLANYNSKTDTYDMTGFGREYEYLLDNGYVFDDATNMMVKKQ